MPAGEMRVTVIATGLDDGRMSARPARVQRELEHPAVPHSQWEDPQRELEIPTSPAPVTPELLASDEIYEVEPSPEPRESFTSPFEDEFDTPAFLRRRASEEQVGALEQEVSKLHRRARE
jgi:hypothetical protein